MIGDWAIHNWPLCTHHAFLSHCAEDRDRLVQPVYSELVQRKFSPWLDKHHYPVGQDGYEALREGIVLCRHVVFFVTAKFLSQGRGWNSIENAYTSLMQQNLHYGSQELCHIALPLFFVPQNHVTLLRSAWGPLIQRGKFYSPAKVDSGAVTWSTDIIEKFIRQEEIRGVKVGSQVQNDPDFETRLQTEPNLLSRIMCAEPPPLP